MQVLRRLLTIPLYENQPTPSAMRRSIHRILRSITYNAALVQHSSDHFLQSTRITASIIFPATCSCPTLWWAVFLTLYGMIYIEWQSTAVQTVMVPQGLLRAGVFLSSLLVQLFSYKSLTHAHMFSFLSCPADHRSSATTDPTVEKLVAFYLVRSKPIARPRRRHCSVDFRCLRPSFGRKQPPAVVHYDTGY